MVDVIISVAAKVAELLVVPIGRHILYPFKYKSNMEELTKQVEKLTDQKDTVQHSVVEATRQGDEIENKVEKWLNRVDEFTNRVAKPIIDDQVKAGKLCSIGFCPNLMARYSLSRKAVKTTKDGANLLGEGTFEKVSYRPLLQKTPSVFIRGYDDFDSRKPIFDNLMEALTEADVNLIGVYGMGGVGKTTLVKRVVGQAIQDKLFDDVVMAEVTETPDIKNIQGQIADKLGLTFQEESLSGRADRLRDRLKKEKRLLLVLDNIWAKLDLEVVGIPLGEEKKRSAMQEEDQKGRNDDQRRCKILLTSRSEAVLTNDMNVEKNFLINILSDEEAGNLFWKTVGDSGKKSDFGTIGIEIVRFCAGLPVAIATIASALKKKSLFDWKDALDQLRRSDPRHIKGMHVNVYSAIKLSYDFLENEEAKSLFLLCSLQNAGSGINIDYLLRYGMGLGLFQNVSTLEQGRNRLHKLINYLKASCLLLDANTNEYVKMHDIIHVVAVSIASTDKLMFNIQDVTDLREMLEDKLPKDSTAISLYYKDVSMLPERLEYPKLKLFYLFMKEFSLQIPNTFFEGLKELRVLDMTKFNMLSLPSSLCKLTNLQTLCLDQSRLSNVAIIGELKRLEILCFWGSDIEQLPTQIGQLTRLRLLELSNCSKLKVISPNVISNLTRLEELYMGNSFIQWEVEGQSNASLFELKQLSRLTTLEMHVLDAQIMPQDLLIFEKLERYRIIIGDAREWSGNYETSRVLRLKLNNINYLSNGVKMLLNRTEDLYLDELKGIKNVLYQLNGEGFPHLKHLHVQNGFDIQYIVNSVEGGLCNVFSMLESLFLHNLINLEKIMCHCQLATESFNKLKIMKIGNCDRLKHLFSFSMVKNLLKLQEIELTNCKKLEEIIFKEVHEQCQQNDSVSRIEFTQLRTLRLQCLPRLTSFEVKEFKPDTGSQEILALDELGGFMPSFSQNVLLPSLENLKLCSINIECMQLDQLPAMSSCCQTLTSLTLEECSGNLKFLFSYSMVKSLRLLETFGIRNCKSIEGIINTEELRGERKVIKMVFPKLINLQLKGLPNLSQFAFGNSVEFPSLTQLFIHDCPKLKTLISSAVMFADIKQSKGVEEMNCQDDIHPLFDQKVVLPTLASLNLSSICIQTIWHKQLQPMSSCFQKLTKLIVDGCDTLKYLFSSSMVESLIQLEVLEISNCKFMEGVIITDGERMSNNLFPKLYQLYLKHLSELTSFCSCAENSVELLSLARLWIENCPKMHTFVYSSPLADMPASKEETVNSTEENLQSQVQSLFDEKVQIPILKFLRIDKMDNMRKIWDHQLTPDSFSKIDYFGVFDCHNLLNVFPSNMFERLQKLEELVVSNCKSVEVIFEELDISSCMVEEIVAKEDVKAVPKLVFTRLTLLKLADLPRLRVLYPGLHISEWPMLKTLRIWGCKKVEKLTSEFQSLQETHVETQHQNFSIQQPLFIVDKVAFPNLETLSLEWNCIAKESMNGNFSGNSCKLKDLQLIDASKEVALCPCFFLYKLPNLERLKVSYGVLEEMFICKGHGCKEKYMAEAPSKLNCLRLIGLNDSLNIGEENSLLCKIFQNLTTLEVSSCNKLKALVSSTVTFQNLTTLEVSKSGGLINLMAISTAKSLVQLARLKIIECKMIEEIIIHEGDREENPIIFSKLEYLELHCLPRLTSFYTGSYVIEFPSLQQIVVRQCPNMKFFSHGALSTPSLHKLQTKEADEGFWEGSLNTTIQKLFKDMDGFRGIENFTVSNFPHLKEVWHKQLLGNYFSNLKSLVVDDKCSSLTYLFTPSVALDLVKLEELEIKDGAVLEAILVIEEETKGNTLFPNLHTLKLRNLPKLSSFCNFAGNAIELPSLATLRILNCPNMQSFISNSIGADMSTSKDNLHTDIQPFFDEKVQLPNLFFLLLEEMEKLRKIWHHQLNSDSFCKIASFGVRYCHNVLNVFPSNMLGRLQKLDELWLTNCSSLDEIFEHEASSCGKTQAITATPLRKLVLNDLPKLKHIWNVDSQGLLTWQNLLSIQVLGCDSLKSIFPASIARSLHQLEKLKIEECCMLEEIVAKEEKVDEAVPRFVFPRLTWLELFQLSSLKSFYPGLHMSEWPVLKYLQVWQCDKVETFSLESSSFQVTHGESQHDMPMRQHLFSVDKVPFTNLESLLLEWNLADKEVLLEKLPEYSCRLKFLGLRGFHKETDICVSCFLHKLPNLEKLKVHRGFFKEIFLYEGLGCEENHVEAPSKLSYLRIHGVSDPLHLWEENSLTSKVFQNLATLEVVCCGNITSLVPSLVSFQNLTTLEVSCCDALLNLVTLSTAKSFVQLVKLSISECQMIKEVITHEGDEMEDRIIFKKLRYLELDCLPSLTSFNSGKYTIEFPYLQQVIVSQCPNMKIFSEGDLNTPRLHKLQTAEEEEEGFWKGNLNTTIELLFTEVPASSIETVIEDEMMRPQQSYTSPLDEYEIQRIHEREGESNVHVKGSVGENRRMLPIHETLPSQPEVESQMNVNQSVGPIENQMNVLTSGFMLPIHETVPSQPEVESQMNVKQSVGSIERQMNFKQSVGPIERQMNVFTSGLDVKTSTGRTVLKILGYMNDVTAGKVGVHGIGGIGKTSVLEALINHIETKCIFDLIIFVSVSRYWSIRKIQNEILRRLSLSREDSETDTQAAERLFQVLSERKFLLLLDDVWEQIHLEAVGIPDPCSVKGSKILMASKNLNVFCDMDVSRVIEVETMSREEAWELFSKQVGGIINSPDIQPFAQAIANGCGGLPLLIIVTGKALTGEDNVTVWEHASRKFSLPGTTGTYQTEDVIQLLKFSFDRLRDYDMKSCFLHCSLFSKDREVTIFELIEYCIQEGVIDGSGGDVHKRGLDIVDDLKRASLLQDMKDDNSIKMHDLIRDLALGILSSVAEGSRYLLRTGSLKEPSNPASSLSPPENSRLNIPEGYQFLLRAGAGLTEPPSEEEWRQAKMIFLMDNDLCTLPERPSCPELLILFLQRNYRLRIIPPSFFDSMTSLKVLNLSKTRVKYLPETLFKLEDLQVLILRDCERLVMLPSEVRHLKHLEVLDLQGTEINELPDEIGELTSLRHLKVSFYGSVDYSEYVKLPNELISSGILSRLKALKTLSIVVYPGDQRWYKNVKYVVTDISNLTDLSSLCFHFPEVELLEPFLQTSEAWNSRRLTEFKFVIGHDVKSITSRVPNLVKCDYYRQGQCLRFVNGEKISDAVRKVLARSTAFYLDHHLTICSLSDFGVSNINGLKLCIISECPKMETVVDGKELTMTVFSSLENLRIYYLWNLTSIWEGIVPEGSFAGLKILSLCACPKLKNVFSSSMIDFVSKLEELVVEDCPVIEEIILEGEIIRSDHILLPSLKKLTLHDLPELVNIWKSAWPSLEHISFYNCPKLKKIGWGSELKRNIREIVAEKSWWDELEWEDTDLQSDLQDHLAIICEDDL